MNITCNVQVKLVASRDMPKLAKAGTLASISVCCNVLSYHDMQHASVACYMSWYDNTMTCNMLTPSTPCHMLSCNVQVKLVAPRDMPKLGKGGTLASRQALLHSLVVSCPAKYLNVTVTVTCDGHCDN